MEIFLGAHMTTGKGFDKAGLDARSIGANAMQVFTRNPRGGAARALKNKELERLRALREEGLRVVCHAPYTINLASSKDDVREFGIATVAEDLQRIVCLGAEALVIHSGAHTGAGRKPGLYRLTKSLEVLLPLVPKNHRILLETMSGQGTELGTSIEEMAEVLAYFGYPENLGVCLDSCHLFAAGYNVCNWAEFKAAFTAHIPWKAVGCLHLNDSKTERGSHKDRHEKLGFGHIGWKALSDIVLAEKNNQFPIIMETPNELSGWADEIARLKKSVDVIKEEPWLFV